MKKILFCATVESHILFFHIPFIEYFQKKGYEVHIAVKTGRRKDELESMNIKLHDISFQRRILSINNFKALRQLINLMKENDFELIHVHTPIASFLCRFAAKITGVRPVLYTAHGFHFYKGANFANWLIYYFAERFAAHWTDGLITINEEDYVRAKSFKLRRPDSVFYINGVGIDFEKYKPTEDKSIMESLKRFYKIKNDDFVLITVAEMTHNKNYIQVLKALQMIDNIKYIIVGYGMQEEFLKDYVTKYKLVDKVIFTGYRNNVPQLIDLADAAILTSYREGLPKFIMEAQAMAKPAIVTNVRGSRDLIKHNFNGLLVEVNDIDQTVEMILKLKNSPELLASMSANAKIAVSKYDINIILKEMNEIYQHYIK